MARLAKPWQHYNCHGFLVWPVYPYTFRLFINADSSTFSDMATEFISIFDLYPHGLAPLMCVPEIQFLSESGLKWSLAINSFGARAVHQPHHMARSLSP